MDHEPAEVFSHLNRKPVVALMGEFSAGKSTLMNLLIGEPALPTKVTATQLPPVWITAGDAGPARFDLDGNSHPMDLIEAGSVDLDDTAYITVQKNSDILELCDLIDMPGISDPNMSAEVWQRVLHNADAIVWCSHATQAWRQSEAAVWATIPPKLQQRSLLLLTRFDKIRDTNDRRRVVKRVQREAEDLFADIFPISLTDALASGDSPEAWAKSGAEAFVLGLLDQLHLLAAHARDEDRMAPIATTPKDAPEAQAEAQDLGQPEDVLAMDVTPKHEPDQIGDRVLPRRVRPAMSGAARPARPPRSTTSSVV